MTNYERIKSMDIKQLSNFLYKIGFFDCCQACYYNDLCRGPLHVNPSICSTGILRWLEEKGGNENEN